MAWKIKCLLTRELFECDRCGQKFSLKSNLTSQIFFTHVGAKIDLKNVSFVVAVRNKQRLRAPHELSLRCETLQVRRVFQNFCPFIHSSLPSTHHFDPTYQSEFCDQRFTRSHHLSSFRDGEHKKKRPSCPVVQQLEDENFSYLSTNKLIFSMFCSIFFLLILCPYKQ